MYLANMRLRCIPMAQWANYHNREEHDPPWKPEHFMGIEARDENSKRKVAAFRGMLQQAIQQAGMKRE